MKEIIATLESLRPILTTKDFKQLALIIEAMLAMTGRVTMLGISRWTEKGGSYRTIQRFFSGTYDWSSLCWLLLKSHVSRHYFGVWLLVGDEVIVTKSGKATHGLGTFYSSIQNQPVSGLCFLSLSLVQVETRKAYPLVTEQLIREEAKTTAPKAVQPKAPPNKGGRPKGSRTKNPADVTLSPFQSQLQGCIRRALDLIGADLTLDYLVYDGALGNNKGLQLVKQTGLHLISKCRHDSSFYFPYTGAYSGKGRPQKYGDRLTVARLTDTTLREVFVEKSIRTCIHQVHVWHKNFPKLLNVVIIIKTHLTSGKVAKVLLFSDDLQLSYDKMIEYYRLRFQIEFNFRDAKQYWGFEDFMNVKETQVNNAAHFSLFMVTFSHLLLSRLTHVNSDSILDLKTVFRARKYTNRIINSLGLKTDAFFINDPIYEIAEIGRIHRKAA